MIGFPAVHVCSWALHLGRSNACHQTCNRRGGEACAWLCLSAKPPLKTCRCCCCCCSCTDQDPRTVLLQSLLSCRCGDSPCTMYPPVVRTKQRWNLRDTIGICSTSDSAPPSPPPPLSPLRHKHIAARRTPSAQGHHPHGLGSAPLCVLP